MRVGLITPAFLSFLLHFRMRRFAYCKVVLATSLVWVMLDMFILLYFSECNKCDNIKERGLPGRDGKFNNAHIHLTTVTHTLILFDYLILLYFIVCIYGRSPVQAAGWAR